LSGSLGSTSCEMLRKWLHIPLIILAYDFGRTNHFLYNEHEDFPDTFLSSAIETENEFIQIVLKIFGFKSTLKGTTNQPLHKRCHQVSAVEVFVVHAFALVRAFMNVPIVGNEVVTCVRHRWRWCCRVPHDA
jgi:hypothetical protein